MYIDHIDYIQLSFMLIAFIIIMSVVHASLPIAESQSKLQIVKVMPIADKIRNLHVITCDLCNEEATYDIFFRGVIEEALMLKRCCENCVKSM